MTNISKKKRVYLCLGDSEVIEDSFGPLVAYFLKHIWKEEKYVLGGDNFSVNRKNIDVVLDYFEENRDKYDVLVLDSMISDRKIGTLIFKNSILSIASSKKIMHKGFYLSAINQAEKLKINREKIILSSYIASFALYGRFDDYF